MSKSMFRVGRSESEVFCWLHGLPDASAPLALQEDLQSLHAMNGEKIRELWQRPGKDSEACKTSGEIHLAVGQNQWYVFRHVGLGK